MVDPGIAAGCASWGSCPGSMYGRLLGPSSAVTRVRIACRRHADRSALVPECMSVASWAWRAGVVTCASDNIDMLGADALCYVKT